MVKMFMEGMLKQFERISLLFFIYLAYNFIENELNIYNIIV